MKLTRTLFTAIFTVTVIVSVALEARVTVVPEDCFLKKQSPCLTQVDESEETLSVGKTSLRIKAGTILHWKNFSEISVDILKGAFHITGSENALKLNEIPIAKKNQMLTKQENLILSLDLDSFILSTYDLSAQRANTVLQRTSFLEKPDFLKFTAQFFERKSAFVAFLKSVEPSWKTEFNHNTASQSKILSRAVASVEESEKIELLEKERLTQELKKVREQFFYRTFYR